MQEDNAGNSLRVRSTESVTLLPAGVPVQPVSEDANAVAKTVGMGVGVAVGVEWPPARAPALRAARMMACENMFLGLLDVDESGYEG